MNKQIIIIGANATGLSAASQIKRLNPQYEIIVLEKGNMVSYSTCSIPFILGSVFKSKNELIVLTKDELEKKRGIKVYLNANVTFVDWKQKIVIYNQYNQSKKIKYDKLVIASGATYQKYNVPILAFTPTIDDYFKAKELIFLNKIKSAIVIGGGFTGIETAFELVSQGVQTTIIELKEHVLPMFNREPAEALSQFLTKHNIKIYSNTQFYEDENFHQIKTSQGPLKADAIFFTAGIIPNTQFIEGIKKFSNGAIQTNQRGETSIENIYAGGDCATYIYNITKKPIYAPLGTYANRIGRIIGKIIGGQFDPGYMVNNTQLMKLNDFYIGKSGENDKNKYKHNTIKFSNAPKASPNSGMVYITLFSDDDGILKGGEIWGYGDISRHLNLVNAYINKPLLELYNVDIPYTPTVNHTWDGITIAAYELYKKIAIK